MGKLREGDRKEVGFRGQNLPGVGKAKTLKALKPLPLEIEFLGPINQNSRMN